jgi:hypothetical protein
LQERGEQPTVKVRLPRQVLEPIGTALGRGQRVRQVGSSLTLVRRERLRQRTVVLPQAAGQGDRVIERQLRPAADAQFRGKSIGVRPYRPASVCTKK